MVGYIAIIAILLTIIIPSFCCNEKLRNFNAFFIIMLSIVLGVTIMACCWQHVENTTPQPIDVYRGKTTLQITYIDSVAIDSVVVFKKD